MYSGVIESSVLTHGRTIKLQDLSAPKMKAYSKVCQTLQDWTVFQSDPEIGVTVCYWHLCDQKGQARCRDYPGCSVPEADAQIGIEN